MMEDLIQFAFIGCCIFGGAAILIAILYLLLPRFREEVKKDWKGE